MDYTDITYEVEKIQSSIRELQVLINKSYKNKFSDGNAIITEAALQNTDNAYESLEQTKALCDILSDAFEDSLKI